MKLSIINPGKMKKFALILVLLPLLFSGCEKIDSDSPRCIREKIRDFAKNKVCNDGSSVSQYLFKGDFVYVFSEGNCGADLGAAVYSGSCEYLGFLGGFAGNQIIVGVNFYTNSEFIKTVWTD